MENILKNIPKKEIEKLQAARAKVDKLKGQLADRETAVSDTRRKIEALESKVRDVIRAAGDPTSATAEKAKLQQQLATDKTTVEFYEEAATAAENELKEIAAKVDHLLGEAVFSEQARRQAEYQKQIDIIEAGLHSYRQTVYQAAESLGLAGPMVLPMIRLKTDLLRDAIQ